MKIIQEHVDLTDESSFMVRVFHEADLSYPFHSHKRSYELTITKGLSGTRMVGDSTEFFSDLDVVLMAPGLPHCWQDHGIKPKGVHKVIVIHFSGNFIPDRGGQKTHFRNISRALNESVRGLKLKEDVIRKYEELFEELDEGNGFENYLRILQLLNLFGTPNHSTKLCSEGYSKPEFKKGEQRLEKALGFIQANYTQTISIKDVAEQVYMSPSAFSHFFKKRLLKSYTEYVLDLRLGKAVQLLQETDLSVNQIGFESGFNNYSYFNGSFKKKYNYTPLAFRKLIQRG